MCSMTVKHDGIICIGQIRKTCKLQTRPEVDGAADILDVNSLVFIFFLQGQRKS